MKYRIAWQSTYTGDKGHGDWFPAEKLEMLMRWEKWADNKRPYIKHWIERA